MEYMEDLVKKNPVSPNLRAIGVDEISVRKGHTYAIVVADLDRQRPIWMSAEPGRDEEHMDVFYRDMGKKTGGKHSLGGHGHVETISQFAEEECAASGDCVRQVSRA